MMKCERIQELLLTDYIDGVISIDLKKKVDDHLNCCCECKAFKKRAIVTTKEVFQGLKVNVPPDNLWSKIEASVVQEDQKNLPLLSWWEHFKSFVVNPAVVTAFAVVLFFVGGETVNQYKIREAKLNEQSKQFLVSVMNSSSSVLISDDDDFGTTVEMYFL